LLSLHSMFLLHRLIAISHLKYIFLRAVNLETPEEL
jgi:hypothetical protein